MPIIPNFWEVEVRRLALPQHGYLNKNGSNRLIRCGTIIRNGLVGVGVSLVGRL